MEHRARVSRYRDELKGLAMLWILWFHSGLLLPGVFDDLRLLGYGGVDVFLFLMGMGLAYSLQKSDDLRGYLSRRAWRMLPAYLPIVALWILVMYPQYGFSASQVVRGVAGNLLMVGYWLGLPGVYNWFANTVFTFALLAPAVYAVLRGGSRGALYGLLLAAFGLGAAVIGLPQMMPVSRFPVFVLGMAFGLARKESWRGIWLWVVFILGLAAVMYCMHRQPWALIDYGMYWYPFVLITPPLVMGTAYLLSKAEKMQKAFAPLRMVGKSSFELYLVNVWIYELSKQYTVSAWMWALLLAANILLGVGYHWLVGRISGTLSAVCRVSGK